MSDFLVVVFKKETFEKKGLVEPPYSKVGHLVNFYEDYGAVIVLGFKGTEEQMTKICRDFQLKRDAKLQNEVSILLIIDKEGIVEAYDDWQL